jgi:hypothetical protein
MLRTASNAWWATYWMLAAYTVRWTAWIACTMRLRSSQRKEASDCVA